MMKLTASSLVWVLAAGTAWAQSVEVKDAWARISVQGQKATGAFMTITARDGAKLVAASTPNAGVAEVHGMKMEGDIMKMRDVTNSLYFPAGQAIELKPGGYHVMLMDLKTALPKGSIVPLTLIFKDAKGVESKVELMLPVSTAAPHASAHSKATAEPAQHKH